MMKRAILLMVLLAAAGCGSANPTVPSTSVGVYTQTDLVVGTGATAAVGSIVTVSYTGWLYDTGKPNGKGTQFDSGTLQPFVVGSANLIQGFQQGVVGMKAGMVLVSVTSTAVPQQTMIGASVWPFLVSRSLMRPARKIPSVLTKMTEKPRTCATSAAYLPMSAGARPYG